MSGRTALGARRIVAVVAWAAAVVPAGAAEFDPYAIPKEQFQARVHTIALKPVEVPWDTPNADSVRQQFESLIAEQLRAKGYGVVPSTAYATIWRQMSERLGGAYDPITGRGRNGEYDAAVEHTGRELARLHRADAILGTYIKIDDAPFGGLLAFSTWDESLRWHGDLITVAPITRPQKVFGAYLNIVITDLSRTTLYSIRAGIEWTAVYVARGYEEKPPEKLYDEPDRNRRAVELDLEPLVPAAAGG